MKYLEHKILPMDRGHLKEAAALERLCFSTPWSEGALEEELYNPHASYLAAEDETGTLLGYAGLHAILDEGYITNIAVHPQHRRKGVAAALLNVYCRFAREHLAFLTLEVRASNEAAIALYSAFGFEMAGRRKDYYQQPREDALIMTRNFKTEEDHGTENTD